MGELSDLANGCPCSPLFLIGLAENKSFKRIVAAIYESFRFDWWKTPSLSFISELLLATVSSSPALRCESQRERLKKWRWRASGAGARPRATGQRR